MTMKAVMNRRAITTGAAGFALSIPFLRAVNAQAQEATPEMGSMAPTAVGYSVARIHTLNAPELVPEIDTLVVEQFVPQVQALPGYPGYLLADSTDDPRVNFTVSLFDTQASTEASTAASAAWVKTLDPKFQHPAPIALDGEIFVAAAPDPMMASTAATPMPDAPGSFVVIRHYQGAEGVDQASLAPLILDGFVPIVSAVEGFQGYLWYIVPDGRVSISLFATEAASQESTEKAAEWVAGNTAQFTDGKPDVYTGEVVFADLPILQPMGC
jgi:hypothetical protein